MKHLYHFGILCYGIAIKLAALVGNSKAKKWIKGREKWKNKINEFDNKNPTIWIHISSLGEYIMTQPLIDLLLNEYQQKVIYLSFFSPSGYENTRIENPRIKKIYLPLDTPANAKYFIKKINPCIAIFAKYDFWFNYLSEIQKNDIPSIVFSTALNKQHVYFKYSWNWHKNILKEISKILVIKEENLDFLQNEGFDNASICGDTRFDQVSNNKLSNETFSNIKKYIGERNSMILGSSWPKEEKIVKALHNNKETALIIAPHEVSEQRIVEIENTFKNTIRYSNLHSLKICKDEVLIIDSIGMLASIYELTDIAVIGGGFSGKLHNILEPASKNNVILFGPNYSKFPEAIDLIELNAARSFSNEAELKNIKDELKNAEKTNTMKNTAFNYIEKNKGASRIVFNAIKELLDHSTTSASSRI